MSTQHSKVLAITNPVAWASSIRRMRPARLVGRQWNRAHAMIRAWALVKAETVEARVTGVTFERRQEAIAQLTRYDDSHIRITLQPERDNAHDPAAVAVIATVAGKGSYTMGYLPRSLAAVMSALYDAYRSVRSAFERVTGLQSTCTHYGLRIAVRV